MFSQHYNKHSLHEDFCTITPCHRIQNTDAFATMKHLCCTQPSTIQRLPMDNPCASGFSSLRKAYSSPESWLELLRPEKKRANQPQFFSSLILSSSQDNSHLNPLNSSIYYISFLFFFFSLPSWFLQK